MGPSKTWWRRCAGAAVLVVAGFAATMVEAAEPAPIVRVTGPSQRVYTGAAYGLSFVPDGHMSVLARADGTWSVWWGGGVRAGAGHTIGSTTKDLRDFVPLTLSKGVALGELGPVGGGTAFDADYAGPGSVLPDPAWNDDRHLVMFYHGENHTFAGKHRDDAYYAAVGVARSADGGRTWVRGGRILDGMVPHGAGDPARSALGAGMPSVVISGGFYWLFYVDWNTSLPDCVHVARAPVSGGGRPGTWRKWYQGSFSEPGVGGRSTPVVTPPRAASIYAGLPDVSWNTALGRWLMVFESNDAYWAVASSDLVSWGAAAHVIGNPSGAASRRSGALWTSYATLISPSTPSDRVTGASGWLYQARGIWGVTDHVMYRVPVWIAPAVNR